MKLEMKRGLKRKTIMSALLMTAISSGSLVAISAPAYAVTPIPRIKPAPPALSNYLSETDAKTFRKGLRDAKRGNWKSVERDIKKINDPVAHDVLRWLRAARDGDAPMKDLEYVVTNLRDWPRMTGIQSKAETRMYNKSA